MIWLINWKVFFYILLSLKCGYIIQLTIYKIASLHSLTGRFCFVFSLVGVVGRILKKTPCCDPCPCIVGCGWNLCIRWHVPVVTESHSTAKGGFPGGLIHTQQPLEFSQLMRRRKSQKDSRWIRDIKDQNLRLKMEQRNRDLLFLLEDGQAHCPSSVISQDPGSFWCFAPASTSLLSHLLSMNHGKGHRQQKHPDGVAFSIGKKNPP